MPVHAGDSVSQGGEMSIIHSIQNSLANAHAAQKEQHAAEAAQADEEAKRHLRMSREEEISREGVRESDESAASHVKGPRDNQERRRKDRQEPPDDDTEDEGRHIDVFA